MHVIFLEPLRTVIVAVPFFRPLTTPLDVTVATFLLDDLKVIFSSVFFGVAMALILKDFPLETLFAAGTPERFVVFTPVTLPDLTVILVVPAFFALITPLELTVATFLFEEEYETFSLLVTGVTVIEEASFL